MGSMTRQPAAPGPGQSWPGTSALQLEDLLDELRERASAARRSQERLGSLLDAVVAVSADLELSEVLGRIVQSACTLVDAKYGALGVLAPEGEHLVEFITRGVSEPERAEIGDLPRGHGILGLLIRDPQPRRMRDISQHPDSFGFPANHPPMHSFLGTPVRIRDEVFGNLYMAEKQGAEEFTAEDEAMLIALAAAAGVAIDNARLYDRSQRQRRWSEAVSELTQTLLESSDEDAALDLMAAQASRLTAAATTVVALYDASDRLVVRAVYSTATPSTPEPPPEVSVGTELEGASWESVRDARQPLLLVSPQGELITHALALDVRRLGGMSPHGPTALLPLALGSGNVGVLALAWTADLEPVASDVMAPLTEFAQQAGLALIAARAQRDRSRMALLEDRDRIARDMHDHVIQRLFATGLSLQSAARLAQHPTVRVRLDDAVDDLDSAIKDIRHTIFELHRPLPAGDLRSEVEYLVDSFAETLGFAPELVIQGRLTGLSPSLEADVIAVVREGLANVARHAQAGTVAVHLVAGPELSVEITDDGVGIEPGSARSGLVNLGARANTRSGTFDLRRRDPHGTCLTWQAARESA
jgi:two-component system, NarL family, sensor histidine kinase DevS